MRIVTPNKLELALRAYDRQLVEARAISAKLPPASIGAPEHAVCDLPCSLDTGAPPHAPPVLAAWL